MILWKDAVTDRRQSDVEYVMELLEKGWENFTDDEKAAWNNGLKGAQNRSDYERIQNNIQLLSDVLELELIVNEVPENPTPTFFKNVLDNTETIRGAYCIHDTTPSTPKAPINTYQKVNDIEQILFDVYEILLNNFHYYCGNEIYAGDSTGLLL